MDSYQECRAPPQLFLLDKYISVDHGNFHQNPFTVLIIFLLFNRFDVAGSGSCLKRYSDPSLLKTHTASAVVATSKLSKDERPRNSKVFNHVIHFLILVLLCLLCHCLYKQAFENAHFGYYVLHMIKCFSNTEERITHN